MIWAMSSHYFPLAYLLLGPALRMLDLRMEEAATMSGGARLAHAVARHSADPSAGDLFDHFAALRARHRILRSSPRHRRSRTRQRLHDRDSACHRPDEPGIRLRQRAEHGAALDLYRRGLFLSPLDEQCGSLCDDHRQGLQAGTAQPRPLALAAVDRHLPDVRRVARPAAPDARLAVLFPQSGRAFHAGDISLHTWRTTPSSYPIRFSSKRSGPASCSGSWRRHW